MAHTEPKTTIKFEPIQDSLRVTQNGQLLAQIGPTGEIEFGCSILPSVDVALINKKIVEVLRYRLPLPVCSLCGGTPMFPNVRPRIQLFADVWFEEHTCNAPIHVQTQNPPR